MTIQSFTTLGGTASGVKVGKVAVSELVHYAKTFGAYNNADPGVR